VNRRDPSGKDDLIEESVTLEISGELAADGCTPPQLAAGNSNFVSRRLQRKTRAPKPPFVASARDKVVERPERHSVLNERDRRIVAMELGFSL
jgi:hypothetical protein